VNGKMLKLSAIEIDGSTQQREKISTEDVESYAEAMRCGAKFPAVDVFFDGVQYWLADGFHRWHAHRAVEGCTEILANIHSGSVRDARLYSAGANGIHGIRPTPGDKKKAILVLLTDAEWSQWSNREIAKHCKVSHTYVNKLRDELKAKEQGGNSFHPSSQSEHSVHPEQGGQTVSTSPLIPAPVADVENEEFNESAQEIEDAAPDYTELDAANDQIAELQDMLAMSHMEGSEEEKALAKTTIADLRAEVQTLKVTLKAVQSSRDHYQQEVAELKAQIRLQRREIDKLTGRNTA